MTPNDALSIADRALCQYLATRLRATEAELRNALDAFRRGESSPSAFAENDSNVTSKLDEARLLIRDENLPKHRQIPTFLENWLLSEQSNTMDGIRLAQQYVKRLTRNDRLATWDKRAAMRISHRGREVVGSAINAENLLCSQGVGHNFSWRGTPCFKSVYDVALYSLLLWELKPTLIVELGSGLGGSALMLADLMSGYGLKCDIHSVDLMEVPALEAPCDVKWHQSDVTDFISIFSQIAESSTGPILVIDDCHSHLNETITSCAQLFKPGDYLVIEDAISKWNSLYQHPEKDSFRIDTHYCDFFGVNMTTAMNGFLVKV